MPSLQSSSFDTQRIADAILYPYADISRGSTYPQLGAKASSSSPPSPRTLQHLQHLQHSRPLKGNERASQSNRKTTGPKHSTEPSVKQISMADPLAMFIPVVINSLPKSHENEPALHLLDNPPPVPLSFPHYAAGSSMLWLTPSTSPELTFLPVLAIFCSTVSNGRSGPAMTVAVWFSRLTS